MNDDLDLALIEMNLKAATAALDAVKYLVAQIKARHAEPEIDILQLAKTPALSIVPAAPAVTVVPEPPKNGDKKPSLFDDFHDKPVTDPCGSPLGYNRRCPVCNECCREALIPTGEKPPKPIGEVVRSTSWHVWYCDKCQTVSVDPCKFVYEGDGDYRRLNAAQWPTEIQFSYTFWNAVSPSVYAIEIVRRFRAMAGFDGDKPVEPKPDGGKAWIAAKPTKKVEVTPMEEEKLILNDEWIKVLDLLNNGSEHIFLTGEGGTGKSTLLQHYVSHCRKNVAVVAPTGVAALRAGGMTLHSFFRFGAHAYENDDVQRISDDKWRAKYEKLDELIIDEASMVRADIMDAVEKHLRVNGPRAGRPFGGVRLILIGDLYQLPPVSKERDEKKYLISRYGIDCPMFFHAECWRDKQPRIVELTTVFRQKDPAFTAALNAIRRGVVSAEQLTLINSRVDPKFVPPVKGDPWIVLTPRNEDVEKANLKMMASLPGPSRTFDAIVSGDFNLKDAPTYEHLELKPGAVVMFVRNNPEGGWVNGTMGKVVSVDPLIVEANGDEHEVEPETWERVVYEFDEKKKKLTRNIAGKFSQVPLKPAAALTIHKAQGTSLDRGIIDLGSGAFASGQAYVAVSRFRNLDGIVLRKPLKESDLMTSQEVVNFMTGKPIARPFGQLNLGVAM